MKIDLNKYIKFIVTGVDRSGKRFKLTYDKPLWAFGINLWRGSVWGLLESGKRELLNRVFN